MKTKFITLYTLGSLLIVLPATVQAETSCPDGTVMSGGKCMFGNVLPGYSTVRHAPIVSGSDEKPPYAKPYYEKREFKGEVAVPEGITAAPDGIITLDPRYANSSTTAKWTSDQAPSQSYRYESTRNPGWETGDVAIGVVGGTTGVGVEAKVATSRRMVLRANYTALDLGIDKSFDGIEYDTDIDLSNGGGFVDFYPFDSGVNVSVGAYIGAKNVEIDATPTEDVKIGDNFYTPEEVGSLSGRIEYDNFAPYAGVGYDHIIDGVGLNLNVKAGVIFAGEAEVVYESLDGTLSDDPDFQSDLASETDHLVNESEDFRFIPVVTVGAAKIF